MISFVLALLIGIQAPTQTLGPDQIKDELAHAESLYYEAKFNDAIQLLARVNEVLLNTPDRTQDRISVNLQLALANIGLNDAASAKSFLREIYVLDPDYALDAQQFSPKVLTLAEDAKTEQNKVRCEAAVQDAQKELAAGDTAALAGLLRTMKPKCADLSAVEPAFAELLYKKGLTEYKAGDFAGALKDFRATLALAPQHEMAGQYVELTQSKLQVAEDRVLLEWQKNFDSHQYAPAAAAYRQIAAGDESSQSETLNHMTSEYRNALVPLVDSWNRSCSGNDAAKMREIEGQVAAMLPDPTFAKDLRTRMTNCSPPAVAAEVKTEPAKASVRPGCLQMDTRTAMTRLKSRVEPIISREAFRPIDTRVTARASVKIDESGNVSVMDMQGANLSINSSVKTAVEHWKFTPAMDQSGLRCVETEIVFVIDK